MERQATLFDDEQNRQRIQHIVERPLARSTDPETSHIAAEEITEEGQLVGLRRRAYELVRDNPGRIARELSAIAGDHDARTINRRLGEIERMGLIYRGAEKRCEVTGRLCATWWAKG